MEKKPILNIMVDLETASTKENAAILSWAMVPFFSDGSDCDEGDFDMTVSLTSCFLAGMDFDKDTQQWWLQQDPKARGAILHADEEVSIHTATVNAYAWLENLAEKYDLYIWSRGLDFDIPKMEWCFRKFVERPLPYKYSHKMDVRTVLKFMQIDQSAFEFKGVKHNALDDCQHDIEMIQKAYELKNQWMMSEVVVSAKKTADKIKEEKAGKGRAMINVPELFRLIPIPQCKLEHDKGMGFSWEQINVIEETIRNQKDCIQRMEKEKDSLIETCHANQEELFEEKMKNKNLEEAIESVKADREKILKESKFHAEANRLLNAKILEMEKELVESKEKELHLTQQLKDLQAMG